MNYELEIRPRFEGMENKRELEEVVQQLALAKEAHPKVCDMLCSETQGCTAKWLEKAIKTSNAQKASPTGHDVLAEEVEEAFAAIADGDMRHAYTEFAQVATVAIRIMQKIREDSAI